MSIVAFRGRHTRSHPQLPLALPETDQEVVRGKGKALEGEVVVVEQGNPQSHFVENPFSQSQFPRKPPSEVSCFLNFGSVPIEVSSPGLGSEGEILVTPLSPEVVPWRRPGTIEDFPTPSFATPPLVTVASSTQRGASTNLISLSFSLSPLLFPTPLSSSPLVSSFQTPSPTSSPLHNIPMEVPNPPMTKMEAIIAARYAPLVLLQPLNDLPADGYLKQLPKFTGKGDITAEEHLAAFYTFVDDNVIMHADV
jgi:hypothetical protein